MTLSDKRRLDNEVPRCYYLEEDVKESIRLILKDCCTLCEDDIKKHVGADLIKEVGE